MIVNVPTAADLETISLQLFFNAWDGAVKIVTEFRDVYDDDLTAWQDEWQDYIQAAQTDLQGIYTLIQQSQEIGIKARIASVSPYLLLKRHDAGPVAPNTLQYDFSDFPTLDASELVRVHNVFVATPLSAAFAGEFEKLRRGRNKIAHLGLFSQKLEPHELLTLLFVQYRELYPDRRWLPDRLLFASRDRWAGMDMGGDWAPEGAVMRELWQLGDSLPEDQHRIVFGYPKDEERFVCPDCGYLLYRHTDGSEPYPGDFPTSFMTTDHSITCAMCLKEHTLTEGVCDTEGCDCDLFVESDRWKICARCGHEPEPPIS